MRPIGAAVSTELVVLHLGHAAAVSAPTSTPQPPSAETPVLRQTLDDAFEALADLGMALEPLPSPDAFSHATACRTALSTGAEAEAVRPLATSCLTAMRAAAVTARDGAAEQRGQMLALAEALRTTMAAAGGEEEALAENLTGTADRFERLTRSRDVRVIHAFLAKEVATLRQITVERRTAWDRNKAALESKLETLEAQLDRTRQEAATDPLTGAANRRAFEDACRQWLTSGTDSFVMACVDVDNFKAVNDRYGHATGDKVLTAVATALRTAVRANDLVSRPGGDEFAVLAGAMTLMQAQSRFAAIVPVVREACLALTPDGDTPSISIGLAERSAGDTLESLQERADGALYQAKRGGKGRVMAHEAPLIRDLLHGRRKA